jgi:hypothetical protein
MSTSLYVRRVAGFLYVGSRRLLHNLTDMRRKPSACIGLHVGMVSKAYQCQRYNNSQLEEHEGRKTSLCGTYANGYCDRQTWEYRMFIAKLHPPLLKPQDP